jgi:regulator of sirC expression with transglutaminase-like and TPR domain
MLESMMTPQQDYALRVLVKAGESGDQALDIGETALALAALTPAEGSLTSYRDFLDNVAFAVSKHGNKGDLDLTEQVKLLQKVLASEYGFTGDKNSYNDLANANLMRVIDRRKGLPVALGIIYLHVGRRLGWDMVGLSFPGHFLIRMQKNGERVILDPFDGGSVREVSDLRGLLKSVQGDEAELMPEHYEPVSDRAVLLRLQNNIKMRKLQKGALEQAVETLQLMVLFAPAEAMLWRELGLFQARLGRLKHAIAALETFMRLGVPESLKHQTALLLQKLRGNMQ